VSSSTDVQITAKHDASTALNAILRVTIPPPVARFTVTGAQRGDSKCTIIDVDGNNDCRLDASTSSGVPQSYLYTYTIGGGSGVQDGKSSATGDVDIPNACNFFAGRSTATDENGDAYFNMDVTLQITDREGTTSPKVTKTVRVYVNGKCGY